MFFMISRYYWFGAIHSILFNVFYSRKYQDYSWRSIWAVIVMIETHADLLIRHTDHSAAYKFDSLYFRRRSIHSQCNMLFLRHIILPAKPLIQIHLIEASGQDDFSITAYFNKHRHLIWLTYLIVRQLIKQIPLFTPNAFESGKRKHLFKLLYKPVFFKRLACLQV